MRRAMFGEPLLAHPAEIGGVHAAWQPHPGDDDDRDQRHHKADDQQHMVAAQSGGTAILTRGRLTVCALVHKIIGRRELSRCLGALLRRGAG